MQISPEIEEKSREIYEKVRRTGTVEQGEPWEPIAKALAQANQHIEWLIRYVKTSESGDAAGVVLNAREFLLQTKFVDA